MKLLEVGTPYLNREQMAAELAMLPDGTPVMEASTLNNSSTGSCQRP